MCDFSNRPIHGVIELQCFWRHPYTEAGGTEPWPHQAKNATWTKCLYVWCNIVLIALRDCAETRPTRKDFLSVSQSPVIEYKIVCTDMIISTLSTC